MAYFRSKTVSTVCERLDGGVRSHMRTGLRPNIGSSSSLRARTQFDRAENRFILILLLVPRRIGAITLIH